VTSGGCSDLVTGAATDAPGRGVRAPPRGQRACGRIAARAEEVVVRVLLLGLMGSGKTTVGRLVAASLGLPYLDNDVLIAEREGRSSVELAAAGGAVLHDAESRLLRALLGRTDHFVAGVPASVADRSDDVALVASAAAVVVYLDVPPDVLVQRVVGDGPRPWLGDDPSAFVRATHARRDPVLREAAGIVVDGALRPDAVAALIVSAGRGAGPR
jgi:shikimate kinase